MASNYRQGRMMMSPISSPERMEYSEEDSSFDQSPLNVYHTRPGMPKKHQNVSANTASRRISCPPQLYHNKPKYLGAHTPSQDSSSRRTTGDFLDTIDKEFGTMQLTSPPSGIQPLFRLHSLPLGTPTISSTPSSMSSKSSASQSSYAPSCLTEQNDSDCSDASNISSATVKSNNNNNGYGDGKSMQKVGYDDDDKMSTISSKTTGPERDIAKQNARKSNRKGQFLCYMHSVVLCLAVCIVGYFGSSELRKMWCVSSQSFNVTHLELELHSKVFGQHIATSVITQTFQQFFAPDQFGEESTTPASVVFSLHGWTGIGKNYMSTIISDLIPTSHVTKLIIPLHFPHSGPEYSDLYRNNFAKWILTNISSCAVNLFIIDEMDKASEPLILGLKNAIGVIKNKQWNNTKIVILLLSNTAGNSINKAVFDHLNNGYDRSDLNQQMMQVAILNDPLATWHVDLHKGGFIDELVPFLPLQYEHVVKCIKSYLKSRGESLSQKKITEIAKEFDYFPHGNPIFSKTGCKRVTSKTDLYLE